MREKLAERVISIDVLRGFALMGIFFVNLPMMEGAVGTMAQSNFEEGLRFVYDLLIQTKFYTIFSFLFGVSAYYFMRSQERKGFAFRQLFVKRAAWLLVFGLLHAILIWSGDILHNYALIGLLLPLFYKWSPKRILQSAGMLFILSVGMTFLPAIIPSEPVEMTEGAPTVQMEKKVKDGVEYFVPVVPELSYAEKAQQNIGMLTHSWFTKIDVELLSLALLGLGLAKAQFFEEFGRYRAMTKKVAIIAFVFTLPIMALMLRDFLHGEVFANSLYVWLSGKLLAAVYVALVLFACEHAWLKEKLRFLASFGKMAFTNYLAQSIVTIFVAIPLLPEFTLTVQLIYCILFLTLQIIVSAITMKKWKYGPFEFVWRKLVFLQK